MILVVVTHLFREYILLVLNYKHFEHKSILCKQHFLFSKIKQLATRELNTRINYCGHENLVYKPNKLPYHLRDKSAKKAVYSNTRFTNKNHLNHHKTFKNALKANGKTP